MVGGRLQVSVRLVNSSVPVEEMREALEEFLLLIASNAGRQRLSALKGSFMSRLTAEGGGNIGALAIEDLTHQQYLDWSARVRQQPAVIRYSLRNMAELEADLGKRKALMEAADHYLSEKHAEWRKEHMERFHGHSIEEEHRLVRERD